MKDYSDRLLRQSLPFEVYIENQISPLCDAAHHFGRNDPAPNYPALIRREFALNLCGTRRQWPILRLHSGQVLCGAGGAKYKGVDSRLRVCCQNPKETF